MGLVWMDNGLIAQCKADYSGSCGGGVKSLVTEKIKTAWHPFTP